MNWLGHLVARQSEFIPRILCKCVFRRHLLGNLPGRFRCYAAALIDLCPFGLFRFKLRGQFATLTRHIEFSVSAWELTDTYSLADIDIAPATSPATPAMRMSWAAAVAAAIPPIRLDVEIKPSLVPTLRHEANLFVRSCGFL